LVQIGAPFVVYQLCAALREIRRPQVLQRLRVIPPTERSRLQLRDNELETDGWIFE
jgi:hypothetical protein